jgi:hypothetical protein
MVETAQQIIERVNRRMKRVAPDYEGYELYQNVPVEDIRVEVVKRIGSDETQEVEFAILKKFVRYNKPEIADVIERIYNHEINLTWGWHWDSGFIDFVVYNFWFGGSVNTINYEHLYEPPKQLYEAMNKQKFNTHNLADAVSAMVYAIACLDPYSPFTKWYLEQPEK